jgi:hypothetical protein
VTDADQFLLDQLDLAPQVIATVIREPAGDPRSPSLSPDDLLNRLNRASLPNFVGAVRRLLERSWSPTSSRPIKGVAAGEGVGVDKD